MGVGAESAMGRSEFPIVEQIARQARTLPGSPALVDRSGIMTFSRLWEEISSCADVLSTYRAGVGQALGLLLPNCALFVAVLVGIARLGRTAILFPTTLTTEELREYCRAAGARVVLTGPSHRELLQAAGGQLLPRARPDLEIGTFDVPSEGGVGSGDFIGQLTSGVDQPPKIAIRTHAAVWSEIEDFAGEISLTARDATLVPPSIAHSYGLIGGTLAPLCWGARVILGERLAPEEILGLAGRTRPTILFSVPVTYRALVAAPKVEGEDLSSLRLCFSAGAPLPRDVDDGFARRFGRRICQNYGSTEAGVISMRQEWTPRLAGSVGRPVRHRTISIADARGRPLRPGRMGEVIVRSPALARCFLGASLPQPTTLQGDRFATGDLGWLDDEGYLFLMGRRSSLIRVAGTLIDPAEVEAVIAQLPGVSDVAVVGMPGPSQAERIKAVVAADGVTAARVLEYCRRYLKGSQVPEIVEFCETLPRTPAGKLLRRALL